MANALENFIMRSHAAENVDANNALKKQHVMDSFVIGTSLTQLYQEQCRLQKCKPDPALNRMLERKNMNEVEDLDLSNLYFATSSAFEAMATVIQICLRLKSLSLENTNINTECLQCLVTALDDHPSLHSLSLANNSTIGFSAAKILLPFVKKNKNVVELNLSFTSMAAPTVELIQKVVERNRELQEEAAGLKSPNAQDVELVEVSDEYETATMVSQQQQARQEKEEWLIPTDAVSTKKAADYIQLDPSFLLPRADAPDPLEMDVAAQKTLNQKCKLEMFDHEERLKQFYPEILRKAEAKPKEIRLRQERGHTLMDAFRDNYRWAVPSDFGISELIAEFSLNLTEADLQELHSYYTPAARVTYVQIQHLIADLSDIKLPKRRQAALFDDLEKRCSGHGAGFDVQISLAKQVCELMESDSLNNDNLQRMLDETSPQLEQYKLEVDRLERARLQAIKEEDLGAAEKIWDELLQLQEKLIDLVLFRLGHLLTKGSQEKVYLALKQIAPQFDKNALAIKQANDDLVWKIEQDISKIQKKMIDEQDSLRFREVQYSELQQGVMDELLANQRQQDKIWRDILFSYRELNELTSVRLTEIDNWAKEVEKQERRKVEYNAIITICESHVRTLKALVNDAKVCDALVKSWEPFFPVASKGIIDVAETVTNDGNQMAMSEQIEYLSVFRRYYDQLGDLLFRRQKRVEELERQIRNCEFQINFCKESLDPAIEEYREQLKDLKRRRLESLEKVVELQKTGDARASQFIPHEETLRMAGIEFDSPLLEMHENTSEKRAKVVQQRQEFLKQDRTELVDRETAELEKVVSITKQARKSGISSLIYPLSPRKKKNSISAEPVIKATSLREVE